MYREYYAAKENRKPRSRTTRHYYSYKARPVNMVVLFWYLVKSDAGVRHCTVVYTGKVTFIMYQKHTAMYNWSPCIVGPLMVNSVSSSPALFDPPPPRHPSLYMKLSCILFSSLIIIYRMLT